MRKQTNFLRYLTEFCDIPVSTAYLKDDMFGFLLVVCNEQGAGSLASPEHHSEVGLIRHTSCFSVEIVLQMPLDETVLTKVLRCRCYNQSINQSINRLINQFIY